MVASDTRLSADQLETIEKLREVLNAIKAQKINIAGLTEYEVHTFMDAEGKPYISLT
jgi:hypothetical protein